MASQDLVTDIACSVEAALSAAKKSDTSRLEDILAKAEQAEGLSLEEAAFLLSIDNEELLEPVYRAAAKVKDLVFGPRVVLFAPLYLSNYCSNDCLYCGFRRSNEKARRKALTLDEAVEQARILSASGFKRILLVAGEHNTHSGVDYLTEAAEAIYSKTDIRILHVNCAPLETADFRRLKSAGYGVYQCFQETYHRETYAKMHPTGRKKDYDFRLSAMDRALEAGFGDVGLGALLGLYDHRYDVLSTIAHSQHIEESFGAAAHTISVPRLRPAEGAILTTPKYPVSDSEFKKIVAVYRLSVPYAGVVVTTREPEALREEVLDIGASQISAGSSTEPGGYGKGVHNTAQFDTNDVRELSKMMEVIARRGLLPSLCTSCYRSGRQGRAFLDVASSGAMKDFCTPNALLSLKEYILDSAGEDKKKALEDTLKRFVSSVGEPMKSDLMRKLSMIEKGGRDIHY